MLIANLVRPSPPSVRRRSSVVRLVEFRVTVGLGQDSVDALSEGVGVVVVGLVKAAVQLALAVEAEDALDAAHQALGTTGRARHRAATPAGKHPYGRSRSDPVPLAGPAVATSQLRKRRLNLSSDLVLPNPSAPPTNVECGLSQPGGGRLSARLRESAEKLAGAVLTGLGLVLLGQALT